MSSTTPDSVAPAAEPSSPRRRIGLPFWAQVFIGLALGVVLGFVARQLDQAWLAETLKTVGGIFVQLLKVIVVPLVLAAIIVSIANLRQVTNAARLAGETLVWFAVTAAASVVVGITLGLLTNPGANATLDTSAGAATGPHRQLARLPHLDRAGQLPRTRGLDLGRGRRRAELQPVVQHPPARRPRARHRRRGPRRGCQGRAVRRPDPQRPRDLQQARAGGSSSSRRSAPPRSSARRSPTTAGTSSGHWRSSPPTSTSAAPSCCS